MNDLKGSYFTACVNMDELRGEWDAATSFAAGAVSERWWSVVSQQYTAEGRVYHGPSYLSQLFSLYHHYQDKLANPQAVALAIFFHKYVDSWCYTPIYCLMCGVL